MHYHAICDFIQYGNIEAKYIPTKDMLADGLTKAVPMAILGWLVESLHLNEQEVVDDKGYKDPTS